MAEKTRGMGRGLAAILATAPTREDGELRDVPVELISPNPAQPRRAFDEEGLVALADSAAHPRRAPARARAPGSGRPLSAGGGRAPLARGAPGGAGDDPGARPPRRRRATPWSSRSSRTWRARTSTRWRRRAPAPPWSRSSASRARTSAGGWGAAAWRCPTSSGCSTFPTRRSSSSPRARSARATAARSCWLPTTCSGGAWRSRPRARGWSVRETEARARGQVPDADKQPRAPRGADRVTLHPDHAEALERVGEELGAALGARPRGGRARAGLPGRADLRDGAGSARARGPPERPRSRLSAL